MAGRWTDDRDREAWERGPYGRELRRGYRTSGRTDDDDDRAISHADSERSFDPRQANEAPLGPVFGERESGADYKPGGRPAEDRSLSTERPGYRAYGGDDRYRDDDRYRNGPSSPRGSFPGAPQRSNAYRQAYGYTPDEANRWEREYHEPGRWDENDRDERRLRADDRHVHRRPFPERDDRSGDGRGFLDRATHQVTSWFRGLDAHGAERDSGNRRVAEHRGRGPANYKRPDERIADEVNERLTDDAWLDASNISVSVSGGEVTLSGTVTEREAKHRAERLIEDLTGVTHVQNNLRVQRGSFLTSPERGFGDSMQAAQMSSTEPGADPSSPAAGARKPSA